jgi:hypothetical protein
MRIPVQGFFTSHFAQVSHDIIRHQDPRTYFAGHLTYPVCFSIKTTAPIKNKRFITHAPPTEATFIGPRRLEVGLACDTKTIKSEF